MPMSLGISIPRALIDGIEYAFDTLAYALDVGVGGAAPDPTEREGGGGREGVRRCMILSRLWA